ncbi:MAG: hypothetical protein WC044_00070 [Crocinitomicaceae bacterium]
MIENTFTTLHFYQIRGFWNKFFAFRTMGFSKMNPLKGKGMLVGKLLGTGAGLGFSRTPNWGQYALLSIWKTEEDAANYVNQSYYHRKLKSLSYKEIILEMVPFQSRGIWDGKNPFPMIPPNVEANGQVAILTRAKLKLKNIPSFWKHVNPVNESLKNAKGRLFSAGMGEWHFSHPITFSVWDNMESAKDFAYQQHFHSTAIKDARDGEWFKEDLFVRFEVKRFDTTALK